MPSLISLGDELLRINFDNNRIEFSRTGGRTWLTRYSGSYCGTFSDLVEFDDEIIALTDKGIYCSSNEGLTWRARCTNSIAKSFDYIQDGGDELLGITFDGHIYSSSSNGATWRRQK